MKPILILNPVKARRIITPNPARVRSLRAQSLPNSAPFTHNFINPSSRSPIKSLCPGISLAMSAPKTAIDHFNSAADTYEAGSGGCTRELAEHVVGLLQAQAPVTTTSKILDNACGTGIVASVLLRSAAIASAQPEIHAVDGAENMVRIAEARLGLHPNFHAAVMPGEALSFPEDAFTHSVTNVGLMFFSDADRGARELWRTLQPGGVAVVTGWAELGQVDLVRRVKLRVRPEEKMAEMPLPKIWMDPAHTVSVMTAAGFSDVQVSEPWVHWGGETAEAVAEALIKVMGPSSFGGWSDQEKERAGALMYEEVKAAAVPFVRGEGAGVGVRMRAIVVVARKS